MAIVEANRRGTNAASIGQVLVRNMMSGNPNLPALEPEFLLYLSFQVEGDLMDGWITQS